MDLHIKTILILSVIVSWNLTFAQNNKKSSELDSAFDQSLSDELEEGFSDIEGADSEEFGSPQTPVQTEEDLISQEFDQLEQEETQPGGGNEDTSLDDSSIDADLDAVFGQDELEREESEDIAEDTSDQPQVTDDDLDAEFSQDELELEEDPQSVEAETDVAETPESPEDIPAELEQLEEEEAIAEQEAPIEEEIQEQELEQADVVAEDLEEETGPLADEPEATPEPSEQETEVAQEPEEIPQEEITPEEPEPELVQESLQPEQLAPFADDPNRQLEAFLDRIFKENSIRLSNERWNQIVGGRQADTYRIQVGDTLWDISVTFFGNGHFWPKLWQLNDTITNPHLIYPGRILQFITGDVQTPPEIALTDVQQEESQQQVLEQQVADTQSQTGIEEIQTSEGLLTIESPVIPSTAQPKPIRKKLPKSLLDSPLNLQSFLTNQSEDSDGQDDISIEVVSSAIQDTAVQVSHFLSESVPTSLGVIVDVEEWSTVASLLQHIYIKSSQLSIGTTYSVFRKKHRIRGQGGRMFGYDIEFQGEVEVLKKLPYPDNIYKAIVKNHNTFIQKGSHIALLNIPTIKLNLEGRQQNIATQVVGGGSIATPHELFALHSHVFLDKGSQAGIAIGDILTIHRNQKVRNKSRLVRADQIPIAKVKVAQVTPERTTAFVIESQGAILIGDHTNEQ